MYGEDNLEAWKGAYEGMPYDDEPASIENVAQLAYDAGLANLDFPQEIEDIMHSHPEDYAQALEAYEDGLVDFKVGELR
tara:strand:+ start:284 stop:520 length:237 start_codon:yes stop_codon:yes gene_type:complete